MTKVAGFLFMIVTAVSFAGGASTAELSIERAVEAVQLIALRSITSEGQAAAKFGAEGVTLFKAIQEMKRLHLDGNLRGVDYNALKLRLKTNGTKPADWIQQVQALSTKNQVVTMSSLTTQSALPGPRIATNPLAVIERLAPQPLRKYAMPSNATERAKQGAVATLLRAAETGSKLCANPTACLSDNIATTVAIDGMGLTERPLTVDFVVEAFTGEGQFLEFKQPTRIQTISHNLYRAVQGKQSVREVTAAIQACLLTGTTLAM